MGKTVEIPYHIQKVMQGFSLSVGWVARLCCRWLSLQNTSGWWSFHKLDSKVWHTPNLATRFNHGQNNTVLTQGLFLLTMDRTIQYSPRVSPFLPWTERYSTHPGSLPSYHGQNDTVLTQRLSLLTMDRTMQYSHRVSLLTMDRTIQYSHSLSLLTNKLIVQRMSPPPLSLSLV